MIQTNLAESINRYYWLFFNQSRALILSGPAFLVVRQAGEGGGGLRGLNTKNQGKDQLTEMEFCMSHYIYKSMPDAKFESGSFFSFGDMTSQNFPLNNATSHRIRIFTFGKWV